jgi:hypothetical protein
MGIKARNIKVALPPDIKAQLQRGSAILNRYRSFLSVPGRQLLQQAEGFIKKAPQLRPEEILNRSQELARQLPDLSDPQLKLFREPDPGVFEEVRKRNIKSLYVETNQGCESKCTFCRSEALSQTSFMPFFMFLQLVEAAKEVGGKINLNFSRSDPFQYRDTKFGAHFGNVLEAAQDVLDPESYIQTHGWPRNHRFARAAAEHLNQHGIRIDRVSVHFFHQVFVEGRAREVDYDRYAERFIQAINLVRPRYVALRGIDRQSKGDPHTLLFVRSFFKEKVLPHVRPDLQGLYKDEFEESRTIDREGAYYYKVTQAERLGESVEFGPYPLRSNLLVGRFNVFPDGSFAFYNGNTNPFKPGFFVHESEAGNFELGKLY